MIDPKVLRIGNILQYANDPRLKEDRIGKLFNVSADDILYFYKNLVDYVTYAALIEEFLIKHNFTSSANGHGKAIFSCEGLSITKYANEDFFRYYNDQTFVKIRHIHQLQNLYFAVLGVEWDVVL